MLVGRQESADLELKLHEEEDHDEEATLLDALEKDLVGSPEDPTDSAPEDGFGSCGQSPTILGTITQNPRVRVRMHSHHQMGKTSCLCGL